MQSCYGSFALFQQFGDLPRDIDNLLWPFQPKGGRGSVDPQVDARSLGAFPAFAISVVTLFQVRSLLVSVPKALQGASENAERFLIFRRILQQAHGFLRFFVPAKPQRL